MQEMAAGGSATLSSSAQASHLELGVYVRILHVNKFLYRRGGAEGYMIDVADLQRRAGHDVALWGMHHPEDQEPHLLEDTFAPYLELEPPPSGLSALTAAGRMVWSPSARRGMERALRSFRPDVVHCHNIFHHLSPSILAPVRSRGIPCVMTLHDYKLACPSYQMLDHGRMCDLCVTGGTWHAVKQRCKDDSLMGSSLLAIESGLHRLTDAYGKVDVFISPSTFLADVVSRFGITPERIRVVNHFVDLQDVPRASEPGQGFLFAGRLANEKGVDTLIEAMSLLPEGAHLDVAGDGPLREPLERLAAERAPGRITFHGRLDLPQLQRLLVGAIASVVPSRWYENQPMTILESFAAAVPVVATNLGGMPELVRDEVEGLLIPHDDPTALAGALKRLSDDPGWAHRMGVGALSRLSSEFGPDTHLQSLDEVYELAREHARRSSRGPEYSS